ncbi:hypothetical protein Aperf_G00000021837 [Anoplocephala perfoliata]
MVAGPNRTVNQPASMTDTSEELTARRNRLAVAPQNCSTDTGASNIRDGVQAVEEASSNEELKTCINCGRTSTPQWRYGNNGERYCNACGIHLNKYGLNRQLNKSKRRSQPRPISMRTDEVRRRNRVPMQQDRRYSFQWSSSNAQQYPTVNDKAGLPAPKRSSPQVIQPDCTGCQVLSLVVEEVISDGFSGTRAPP